MLDLGSQIKVLQAAERTIRGMDKGKLIHSYATLAVSDYFMTRRVHLANLQECGQTTALNS